MSRPINAQVQPVAIVHSRNESIRYSTKRNPTSKQTKISLPGQTGHTQRVSTGPAIAGATTLPTFNLQLHERMTRKLNITNFGTGPEPSEGAGPANGVNFQDVIYRHDEEWCQNVQEKKTQIREGQLKLDTADIWTKVT